MKIVYIAGPYTSDNFVETTKNVEQAKTFAKQMAAKSIGFLSPITNSAYFDYELGDNDPGYEFWIDMTLALLVGCDAIFFCPGWEDSRGAKGEYAYAQKLGLPIFDDIDQLNAWYHQGDDE